MYFVLWWLIQWLLDELKQSNHHKYDLIPDQDTCKTIKVTMYCITKQGANTNSLKQKGRTIIKQIYILCFWLK